MSPPVHEPSGRILRLSNRSRLRIRRIAQRRILPHLGFAVVWLCMLVGWWHANSSKYTGIAIGLVPIEIWFLCMGILPFVLQGLGFIGLLIIVSWRLHRRGFAQPSLETLYLILVVFGSFSLWMRLPNRSMFDVVPANIEANPYYFVRMLRKPNKNTIHWYSDTQRSVDK